LRRFKTEAALSWIERRNPSVADAIAALRTSLSNLSEAAGEILESHQRDIKPELKDFLIHLEGLFDV